MEKGSTVCMHISCNWDTWKLKMGTGDSAVTQKVKHEK